MEKLHYCQRILFFANIINSDALLFLNYSRCNTTANKRTNENSC
jgi:hypothetical protein